MSAMMAAGPLCSAAPAFAANGKWVKSGENFWFKNDDGSYPANKWEKINGSWYHFSKDGWMQSGWKKIDGNWYYLGLKGDGSMKKGWINVDGSYYYLDSAGIMKTGWVKVADKWYYFWGDGRMAFNATVDGYKLGFDGAWIPAQNNTQNNNQSNNTRNAQDSLDVEIFRIGYQNALNKT